MNESIMLIGDWSNGGDALLLNPPAPINGFAFGAILITTFLLGGLLAWINGRIL